MSFQPKTLLESSLLKFPFEQLVEIQSEVNIPELTWEFWSEIALRDYQVPVAYFDLSRERNLSGYERYLEIASKFELLPQHALSKKGDQVYGLYEAFAGLMEAVNRNDLQFVDFFFSRLKERPREILKEKIQRGDLVPIENRYHNLGYQRLVFLLFGQEGLDRIFPDIVETNIELGQVEAFSSLFNSDKKFDALSQMISMGNPQALLQVEEQVDSLPTSKKEAILDYVASSGDQVFLERYLWKVYGVEYATKIISVLRSLPNVFNPEDKPEDWEDGGKYHFNGRSISSTNSRGFLRSSNPVFVDLLTIAFGFNISEFTNIDSGWDDEYIFEEIEFALGQKAQSHLNPVGLYQVCQRIHFEVFNSGFGREIQVFNDIDLLIRIYNNLSEVSKDMFVNQILFPTYIQGIYIARQQNIRIYDYFLPLHPHLLLGTQCQEFLRRYSELLPFTCNKILALKKKTNPEYRGRGTQVE